MFQWIIEYTYFHYVTGAIQKFYNDDKPFCCHFPGLPRSATRSVIAGTVFFTSRHNSWCQTNISKAHNLFNCFNMTCTWTSHADRVSNILLCVQCMSVRESSRENDKSAYIDDVIVKQHPHAMTLDDADVMSSAQPAAAVNHNRYQVVHSIWIACIVRLHHTAETIQYPQCGTSI